MSIGKVVPVLAIFTVLFLFLGIGARGQPSMSVDMATGRITIRASRKRIDEVEKAKAEFPLETRQIQIKARLLELTENATRKFGINLKRLTGVEVPLGVAGEGTALELDGGALQYIFYNLTPGKEKLEAILDALIITGEAKILSAPQVSTLSGQVAGIYVVQDVPYEKGEKTDPDTGEKTKDIGYITVGVVLQVLPDIVGEDLVQMSIFPMVSDFGPSEGFGYKQPTFYREIAPTNITVRSGETIVIGGLMREEETEVISGLPILSQLPIIGNLFKRSQKVISKTNLVVTVEPRIITPREIQGRTKKVFVFKYGLAEEMADRVREILSTEGTVEMNPREAPPNSILVRDNEDKIEVIQILLNEIGTFEQQRREDTFQLLYSTPQQIEKAIAPLLSPGCPVRINEEAKSVTIEDGAYQLVRMKEIISSIEEHNQIPRTKVFYLDKTDGNEILSSLEKLLSPQGSIEIVDNSLIVKDNNWVIEQIRKRIEELDIS